MTDDDLVLSEQDGRRLAAMERSERRLLLAMLQTTNPKRKAKLEGQLRALHQSRR